MSGLLTGRQLVGELLRLGVGRWSGETVRGWIREEPACPIAEHADQGKPHRYELVAVLTWLRTRALAERAKGFSSGDGPDLFTRVDAAMTALSSGQSRVESAAAPIFAADVPAGANASDANAPPQAPQQRDFGGDWAGKSDVEALLEVLQGRDPRNWRAAEEALNARRKRLVEERKLIPVDELQMALDLQTEDVRSKLADFVVKLKAELRVTIGPERGHDIDRCVDLAIVDLQARLASTDGLSPSTDPASPTVQG